MNRLSGKGWLLLPFLLFLFSGKVCGQLPIHDLGKKFLLLRDTTTWKQIASIPLLFPAHHPQGMVKIGTNFYLSSVEVLDRAAGEGIGHLFEFDASGKLLADLKLGEGPMYHPGGIDFDREAIWVPVAEYRPDSRSVVYKVDPATLATTEVFRFADHIGGIVHDFVSHKLHGINWGSRHFYQWALGAGDKVLTQLSPEKLRVANPTYYIDYQDCHYIGNHRMLCGGLKNYRNGDSVFRLGGLEMVDLLTHRVIHQIPVQLWSPSGRPMTQNPFWLESTEEGIRGYFVPDDNQATMYVYEAKLPVADGR
ncbi:DUF6454 family protein [Persicitalea jodogahamensis]|uniref:Uncharacterized protein n=1 Tax=Persicitalea jodogahamensis TaxID=402147 RepID=A0A8J3D2E7_9BACT|nr:DUF6454 family protein [Persicitalea jodogahamensis]GHB61328.1 hypothetical protein GCM10007390_13900 [Persicitalea jodogahamensis]